jgi:MFS family permease
MVPAFIPQRPAEGQTHPEMEAAELATQQEIRAAAALDHASYNVGRAVAPVLAVLVVSRIGFGWAFLLNAASFLVLAAALRKARPCSPARPNSQAKIRDSVQVISRDRRLQLLLAIVAAVTISADPVLVLGPALARHFGLPDGWAGYFLSALGLGTVLGLFVPVRPPARVRQAAYPLVLLGASVVIFALGVDRWLSLAASFAAGIACLLAGAATRGLLFTLIPPERQRQRRAVMAVWAVKRAVLPDQPETDAPGEADLAASG